MAWHSCYSTVVELPTTRACPLEVPSGLQDEPKSRPDSKIEILVFCKTIGMWGIIRKLMIRRVEWNNILGILTLLTPYMTPYWPLIALKIGVSFLAVLLACGVSFESLEVGELNESIFRVFWPLFSVPRTLRPTLSWPLINDEPNMFAPLWLQDVGL